MKKLIKSAETVPDMRRQWGHILHKLSDIVVISFCAIICGAQTYRDIELFGKAKELWLSNYLSLPNGIPNADTFERIFEMLDPKSVAEKMRWLFQTDEVSGHIIAFDGKTMCGSAKGDQRAFHMLTAFLTDSQTVIGEVMCNEKSNEITAIPELLDTIHTQNAIITIDAMGTQTKIAEKIIEKREYFLETEIEWIDGRERLVGLKAIGGVKSTVTIKEKKTVETRNFITSLNNIDDFARAVRAHWGIENGLHWHLDVTFGEI